MSNIEQLETALQSVNALLARENVHPEIAEAAQRTRAEIEQRIGAMALAAKMQDLQQLNEIRALAGLSPLSSDDETTSPVAEATGPSSDNTIYSGQPSILVDEPTTSESKGRVFVFDLQNRTVEDENGALLASFIKKRADSPYDLDVTAYSQFFLSEIATSDEPLRLSDMLREHVGYRGSIYDRTKRIRRATQDYIQVEGETSSATVTKITEFTVASKWRPKTDGKPDDQSKGEASNPLDLTLKIENDAEELVEVTNEDVPETITDIESSQAFIEDLRNILKSYDSDVEIGDELDELSRKFKVVERQRLDKQIYRLDPERGLFDGTHLASSISESPNIRKHYNKIIDGLKFLAKQSEQDRLFIKIEDFFAAIDPERSLTDFDRRMVRQEISQLLGSTKKAWFSGNNPSKPGSTGFWINGPFDIVVTEVQERPRKAGSSKADVVLPYKSARYDEKASIADRLLSGITTIPTSHREAVKTLDVLMDTEVKKALAEKMSHQELAMLLDYGHSAVWHALGSARYFEARRNRMLRSGRPGSNGIVRQVTGSQENERFERISRAEPDSPAKKAQNS